MHPAHRPQAPFPGHLSTPLTLPQPQLLTHMPALGSEFSGPLTQVSQPIFAHSARTHISPRLVRTSAQAHTVPNSMFSFRRERRTWSLGGGRGAQATGLKECSSGAGSRGWDGGMDKPVPCRGASPNPAGARGPRVHLSSYYCNKSELYYMKGKMNYRR